MFGSSANDVYLIVSGGLLHWDGTAWTPKTLAGLFGSGWANSATDIWLSGDSLLHYDGVFFVTLNSNSSTPDASKPFGSASEMWTFDLEGASRWQGGFGGTPLTERLPFRPTSARLREGDPIAGGFRSSYDEVDRLDQLSNGSLHLINAGRFDEAERMCQELLAQFPDVFDGHMRLGQLHRRRGDNRKAAEHLRLAAAMARSPDYDVELANGLDAEADQLDPPPTV